MPLCWVVAERRAHSPVLLVLCFWSRQVTVVYFVQWMLFGWAMLLLETNGYDSPAALGIGVAVLLLTHIITVANAARTVPKADG